MIAIPTLILALVCLFRRRQHERWTPLALLLSAVGDAAGSMGYFGGQLGAFALALCCYTATFAPHCVVRGRRVWLLAATLIGGCSALMLLLTKIASPMEAWAVGIYGMVLLTMLSATLLQRRKQWGWYVVAALLFVLSDALIGYSRYMAPRPIFEGWIILPYYAAQLIFARQYLTRKQN